MSTRSYICRENEDHTYTGIYCHWDGYPLHHGPILTKNYDTRQKVNELLILGELSSLDETPEKCCAYHRDRGEPYEPPYPITVKGFMESFAEYMYVFCLDSKWRYFDKKTCDEYSSPLSIEKNLVPHNYYYYPVWESPEKYQVLRNGDEVYINVPRRRRKEEK